MNMAPISTYMYVLQLSYKKCNKILAVKEVTPANYFLKVFFAVHFFNWMLTIVRLYSMSKNSYMWTYFYIFLFWVKQRKFD